MDEIRREAREEAGLDACITRQSFCCVPVPTWAPFRLKVCVEGPPARRLS
jgi:hypothetical protein